MFRACLHHRFSELTQIDTFYNGLNEQDQDSLNAAAGGNLLSKTTREALKKIKNKSKVCYSRSKSNVSRVNMNSRDNASKADDRTDKLADQILNLVKIVNKQVITPASAKAVEKTCVTCGGAHAYYNCIATDSNQSSVCATTGSYNQVSPPNRASQQIPSPGFASVQNNPNRFNQNQGQGNNFQGNDFQNNQVPNNQIQPGIPDELSSYMKSNEIMIKSMQNQINVLRGDFNKQEENLKRNLNNDKRSILGSFFQNKASTSGTLSSNTIPNPKGEMKAVTTREKIVEQDTEETTEKEHSNYPGSTAQVHPPVFPISILEPDILRTQPKPTIPYPSRLNDQKLHEKATNQMEKFFLIFYDLHFDISFADALLLMPKFASTIKSLLTNKDKLLELANVPLNENCSTMLLKKLLEKLGDPGKFLSPFDFPGIDGEMKAVTTRSGLAYEGPPIPANSPLEKIVEQDTEETTKKEHSNYPRSTAQMTLELAVRSITHPKGFSKDVFVKVGKFHFPMDFVVVDFKADPRVPLILVRSFLRTGRALIDVYGEKLPWEGDILYLEKLLNEDPFQLPSMDLKLAEETKAKSFVEEPPELELKRLPSHLNPWVSPIHCVPKKGGMTVVANENNELIPTRLVTGWRVCIDYRKLNDATRKDHFPLPFMDQMLERLAGNEFYCFLDGFSEYFKSLLIPKTRKTTFTCPYGTFAYRRMPFGLCNAPGTFQMCMMAIFHDIIEKTMEVFMDNFSVFGDSFSSCLTNLDKMLKRCEETNLVLNWEKCHFMCREGIVLGVRSFLGHAGFYRRFIQDFSEIAKPMTHLLEKETPFVFSKECVDAFNTLKKKLTEAPILVVPDWSLPFELMCDASDFAIGATLIGFTPYKLVYGKSCHLPIELEHWAYWALKHVNFDLKNAGDHRKLQLNELSELHDQAYENSVIYKERTKKLHESKIKNRIFNIGDQVLLFNSRLKIFSRKLKTRWSGPFTIT
nr:reverse transcriptase domain-containing protein [Tanacetum cinerariifolium]